MSLYPVLVVDDEPIARQSLKYLIDWEKYGFSVAGEAEDGLQAIGMLRARYYSMVLTDIRMPVMDGLEMAEKLMEFSQARVVILSGYDDFDYARQGIKLGVHDYLLKPLDEEDLIRVLTEVRSDIQAAEQLTRRQAAGTAASRDRFLRKLAHGQLSRRETAAELRLHELPEEAGAWASLIVELDSLAESLPACTELDAEMKRFAVRNIMEELVREDGYVFEESDERLGVLYAGELDCWTGEELRQRAERMAEALRLYAKESVSIGIGSRVQDICEVKESFRAADVALDGKFLTGVSSILSGRLEAEEGQIDDALLRLEDDVLDAVGTGGALRVQAALGKLWDAFTQRSLPPAPVRQHVLELLVRLYGILKERGIGHEGIFGYQLDDYGKVMSIRTRSELLRFMEDKCLGVVSLLGKPRDMRPNKVLEEVKSLVHEQYGNPISLKSIAGQIYMNPSYLGKLFKTQTGTAFNDYLLHVRMEQAKRLLLQTDKKVYEIAQEVGFGELDWFYKRFKAYTGLSTGEFRSPL